MQASVMTSPRFTVTKRNPHLLPKNWSVSAFLLYAYCINIVKAVSQASAVVRGARNSPTIGIQKDHKQMVKFPSNSTNDYKHISLHVKRMVAEGTHTGEA